MDPKTRVSVAVHDEDLACGVLPKCDRRTDGRTNASTMAKTREALDAVAHKSASQRQKNAQRTLRCNDQTTLS